MSNCCLCRTAWHVHSLELFDDDGTCTRSCGKFCRLEYWVKCRAGIELGVNHPDHGRTGFSIPRGAAGVFRPNAACRCSRLFPHGRKRCSTHEPQLNIRRPIHEQARFFCMFSSPAREFYGDMVDIEIQNTLAPFLAQVRKRMPYCCCWFRHSNS